MSGRSLRRPAPAPPFRGSRSRAGIIPPSGTCAGLVRDRLPGPGSVRPDRAPPAGALGRPKPLDPAGPDLPLLANLYRLQVGSHCFDDPSHLSIVARLALDHDVVAELSQLDARIGEERAKAALKKAEVSQYSDFEGIDLILSRGDGQIRDPDPQARDSNLTRVEDRELDDGGVARGDQRLVGPGREIFLDREDPALAHVHLEGRIVSLEAVDKRASDPGPEAGRGSESFSRGSSVETLSCNPSPSERSWGSLSSPGPGGRAWAAFGRRSTVWARSAPEP